MKKILISVAVIAAVVSVVGGTVAYFTSSDESVGNTFTTGNMKITLDEDGNHDTTGFGSGLPIVVANMAPGDSDGPFYAAVANEGSLPFEWAFSLNQTASTPGDDGQGNSGGNLGNVLKVNIQAAGTYDYQSGFNCQNEGLPWATIYDGFVADGTYPDAMGVLDPDKGYCFRFVTRLDGDLVNANGTNVNDNKFQNASVTYEMLVDAYQANDPANPNP